MVRRLVNALVWLLVAGSVAIILGGLVGRPILVAAVPTTSMVPVLRPGDLIPVLPLFGQTPKQGQIVVYKTVHDSTWIVHRIVGGNQETGFITRGDANTVADPNPVHISDIAGYVPQYGHWAARIPHVGSISLGRSPLSNPIVAAAALLLGVYLLIADSGASLARFRALRVRRHHKLEITPSQALGVYVGLAVILSLMTFMTTWSLTSHQVAKYQVVPTRSTRVFDMKVSAVGEPRTDEVNVRNLSWIPVIVALSSDDPDMEWSRSWFLLPPKADQKVSVTRHSRVAGQHTVMLRQAYYVPLLPASALKALAAVNWYLPIFVVSLIPTIPVLALAFADRRVNRHLRLIRLRMGLGA